MIIKKNISLIKYNTFGLDYKASCVIHIRNEKEATSVFAGGLKWKKPLLIIGGGSNLLFTNDFKGTILIPEIRSIKVEEESDNYVIVSAGAGLEWDKLVAWSVSKGFGGLENLSHIPGDVGATPVQNIGAYGVEVKNLIVKVRAISTSDGSKRIFDNDQCRFEYRASIFKNMAKGKYLITRVYYRLSKNGAINLDYGSLKDEVSRLGVTTLNNIRQAVINIRSSKLPDPEKIGNAGSFFKNPVVDKTVSENLKIKYPQIPLYDDISGGIKLSAGWLIEQCGWKGRRIGDAGIHKKQALVLVNYGKASGSDIYRLSEDIKNSVFDKFGIALDREVEVIGAI